MSLDGPMRLAQALAELRDAATAPASAATAMPAALYHLDEMLALEQERLFAKGWICPGLLAEIPEPGDYLTYSIADQPIVVIRGPDGVVRAFSNVCRHRMMILLEGYGNAKRVVCPYHAWTYDLKGRLVGARHMERSAGFDRGSLCLPELRCELWKGWIYVTLNRDAPPLADLFAPIAEIADRYGMEEYVPVLRQDETWQTNWKCLVENFMEGYHGPVAHQQTVGAGVSIEETGFPDECYDGLTWSSFTKPENARYGVAHPSNTRLEGVWRRTGVQPTVFPAHMYSLSPDYLWYLSLRPEGVGTVKVRIGVAVAPEIAAHTTDMEALVGPLSRFFDQVNAEDRMMVQGIFAGSAAPLATPGPLSWLERELHDFMRYLNRSLT